MIQAMITVMNFMNLIHANALMHPQFVELFEEVAAWSKAWVCGSSLFGIAGSNPAGGMNVSFECCVLSGRGLWVGLIARPEESYRVRSV